VAVLERAMRHTVRQCVTFDDFMEHVSHDELFAICPCSDDIYQEPLKTCVTLQYKWPPAVWEIKVAIITF
jgi:hypothetical protein